MMNYQLITSVYNGKFMELVARGEDDKKYILEDDTHESYFYVPEDQIVASHSAITKIEKADGTNRHDWIPFPVKGDLDLNPVKRIFVKKPTDVSDLRATYHNAMEADVPYRRRYGIDRGIWAGFNDNLEPTDFALPSKNCVIDIEVFSRKKQNIKVMIKKAKDPIVMIGFKFGKDKKPIQLVLDRAEKRRGRFVLDNVIKFYFLTEVELLIYYWKILKKLFPDVLTGWNISFDVNYIENRCEKLVKQLNHSRRGNVHLLDLQELLKEKFHRYMQVFDLMNAYDQIYKPTRKGLKYVEVIEGFSREVKMTGGSFSEDYIRDQAKAEYYNLEDINNTWGIDEKREVIIFFWNNRNFSGLESLEGAKYVGRMIDTVGLRLASGRYALPCGNEYTKEEREALKKFKGATVLESQLGIWFKVGVFDFSRFYPTIMKAKSHLIGYKQDFMLELVDFMWKARDRLEELMDALEPGTPEWKDIRAKWMTSKFGLNGVYGKGGDPTFRLFDIIKSGKVTRYCRAGLKVLKKVAEELGFKVLSGDTDSIFIQLSTDDDVPLEELIKIGKLLEDKFNSVLMSVFKTENLKVELETIWNPVCFLAKKKSEDAAKKKYFGNIIYRDGKILKEPKMEIKGMESVKRDTAMLTKVVTEQLFDYILNNQVEKVLPYLQEVYRRAKDGRFSVSTLAIGKRLSRNVNSYTGNVDYIRGSKYANKYIYKSAVMGAGTRAFMLFVSQAKGLPKTNVICLESPEDDFDSDVFVLDWQKTMERTLEMPLESILALTGLTWKKVRGMSNISSLMM